MNLMMLSDLLSGINIVIGISNQLNGVIKVFWGFSKVSWGRILWDAAKTPKYFGG